MLKDFTTPLAFLLMKSEEIQEQKEEEHPEKISVLISTEPAHLQLWRHIQSSSEDRATAQASLVTPLLNIVPKMHPSFLCLQTELS